MTLYIEHNNPCLLPNQPASYSDLNLFLLVCINLYHNLYHHLVFIHLLNLKFQVKKLVMLKFYFLIVLSNSSILPFKLPRMALSPPIFRNNVPNIFALELLLMCINLVLGMSLPSKTPLTI